MKSSYKIILLRSFEIIRNSYNVLNIDRCILFI